jgi:MATE family multidrug resistance protein
MHFVDRMFLAWYSAEALAASVPAGILNYTLASLFISTAGYVSTFIAQYTGAGRGRDAGPILWQSLYLSLFCGVLLLPLIPLAPSLFDWIGHAPAVRPHETAYFRILCAGNFPAIAAAALSGFFSGLGRTLPIMWLTLAINLLHAALDYVLVFGKFGCPEMGISGAALASVISAYLLCVCLAALIFTRENEARYGVRSGRRFDLSLLRRLLRFGLPSGAQIFLDVGGITCFILFVGRLGVMELAATNLAFNINGFAFMPMIGLGTAVSVLVGRYLGADRPDHAQRSVTTGLSVTFLYMVSIGCLFWFLPGLFLYPFAAKADPATFPAVYALASTLLKFVAAYSLFDTLNIIVGSCLRGAGDTRFVFRIFLVLSIFALALPAFIAIIVLHRGIYTAWTILSLYCALLGICFLLRYLNGKWKSMRVIEEPVTPLVPLPVRESAE